MLFWLLLFDDNDPLTRTATKFFQSFFGVWRTEGLNLNRFIFMFFSSLSSCLRNLHDISQTINISMWTYTVFWWFWTRCEVSKLCHKFLFPSFPPVLSFFFSFHSSNASNDCYAGWKTFLGEKESNKNST